MLKRILTLRQRHAQLDQALAAEVTRPLPDDDKLKKLKQMKLAIKDEIARLHRAWQRRRQRRRQGLRTHMARMSEA